MPKSLEFIDPWLGNRMEHCPILNADVQTIPVSQCAPLGGLVVRRRSGLVDMSEKQGQLGTAACGPVCEHVLNADGVLHVVLHSSRAKVIVMD
jgi:hypothetical protein